MQAHAVKKLLWGVGAIPTCKVTSGPPPGLTEVDDNTDLYFLQPPEESSTLNSDTHKSRKPLQTIGNASITFCFL